MDIYMWLGASVGFVLVMCLMIGWVWQDVNNKGGNARTAALTILSICCTAAGCLTFTAVTGYRPGLSKTLAYGNWPI